MNDRILVVDDDPGTIQLIGRILHDVGDLSFATSGEQALQLIHNSAPDLILLDAELPGMSGFKVFDALKAEAEMAQVPIIFLTSHNETGFETSALNMGAADFISKPFAPALLLARVNTQLRIKRTCDELRGAVSTDPLTGLGSRHQFDVSLQREWLRGLRVGDPMSLLLIEVDHYDLYCKRYGHARGDACLRRVATAIKGTIRRPADFVARCAGEQFGLLLPQTARRGAEYIAHRILEAVEALKLGRAASSAATGQVTVSIGVSCYDEQSTSWVRRSAEIRSLDDLLGSLATNMLLAADKALYSAKAAGHARARLLDISELEAPFLIRDIEPSAGEELAAKWA